MTWRYTDKERRVVISHDGCQSCLASSLPEGTEILPPIEPAPSLDDYKAAIEAMLQAHAKSLDYISWDRLLAHTSSPDPMWREDGVNAWNWKTDIDRRAYQILDDVQRGKIPQPSISEFLALLPEAPK